MEFPENYLTIWLQTEISGFSGQMVSTHSLGRGLYFNGNFWLCTHSVNRICHAGAVANVDFKLCRSLLDGNKMRRKVESSSSEAKIVRIRAGGLKIFPSLPDKGTNGLSFFALEGKIEQRIRTWSRSFKTAVSCLDFVYRKLRQTDLKTPQKRRNRPNGQQKSGKVSSFT